MTDQQNNKIFVCWNPFCNWSGLGRDRQVIMHDNGPFLKTEDRFTYSLGCPECGHNVFEKEE